MRVQKTVGSSSTVFLWSGSRDVVEYDNGAAPASPSREFIYGWGLPGSGLVASITAGTPPTTVYFHSDHLSTRLITNSTGAAIGQQAHYPFGESWYAQNSANGEFVLTTYQRDGETGLDYALARYYDSGTARFCSADPVGGRPGDPQSWNRYVYVRNDPNDLTDPQGRSLLGFLHEFLNILINLFTGDAFHLGEYPPSTPPLLESDPQSDTAALMGSIYHPIDPAPFVSSDWEVTPSGKLVGSSWSDQLCTTGGCGYWDPIDQAVRFEVDVPSLPDESGPDVYEPVNATAINVFSRVYKQSNFVTKPSFIAAWYGVSAIGGFAGAAVADYSLGPAYSALFGRFAPVVGGFSGYLNSGSPISNYFRIGFGWNGANTVFRISGSLVPQTFFSSGHIDLWTVGP